MTSCSGEKGTVWRYDILVNHTRFSDQYVVCQKQSTEIHLLKSVVQTYGSRVGDFVVGLAEVGCTVIGLAVVGRAVVGFVVVGCAVVGLAVVACEVDL